jgi:predicted metal-dependent hydrolase
MQVRAQRTRWGSCSRRGGLSFNWRLVQAPPEVLDYVVVHELAHIVHPNHSTAFWMLVHAHCPDYPAHKRWLRRHSALLAGGSTDG